jgi:hypothetical protein
MIQETKELHVNDSGFAQLVTRMMDAMVRQSWAKRIERY